MTIRIMQSTEKKSSSFWKWRVWLDGDSDELDNIQSVIYQLHSTFKNPIREISDRQSGFRIDSAGWGQFMIYLTIKYNDGYEEKRKHWLQFSAAAPSKELEGRFGEKFKDRAPTAYLSYSVADTIAAKTVRDRLEAKGVSVLDVNSLQVGENLNDGINNMIDQSDFGVSIVSDITSESVNQETQQMKEQQLPVFQVNSGSNIDAPNKDLKVLSMDQFEASDFSDLFDDTLDFNSK